MTVLIIGGGASGMAAVVISWQGQVAAADRSRYRDGPLVSNNHLFFICYFKWIKLR